MRIGFLTSHRGQEQFPELHWEIIHFLEKKGHEVIHSMDVSLASLIPKSYPEREKIFLEYFKRLDTCDVVLAECSIQSTKVGFGLAYLREKGKPIIIVSEKGSQGDYSTSGEVYSEIENMIVAEYTKDTLLSVIAETIELMDERLDKRFTMIFPAWLMAKLETTARDKKLPKAVYIRQLLEESLKKDDNTPMMYPYIPYFQTTRYRVHAMIELANIKPGEKAADLGSGDGRIVVALAQNGAIATGYELDEKLINNSLENIKRAGVNATILKKDFWEEDLSVYDIICVYPMPDIMEGLEEKLQKELRPGSRVLLNYYPFPNWKETMKKDYVYLYTK